MPIPPQINYQTITTTSNIPHLTSIKIKEAMKIMKFDPFKILDHCQFFDKNVWSCVFVLSEYSN